MRPPWVQDEGAGSRRWLTRSRLNFFFAGFSLAQLVIFLVLESTGGMLDRQGRVRGRDFLQFYIAGRIVAGGNGARLYDQDYFLDVQRSLVDINELCPPYLSLYPPATALLFAPLGALPYDAAVLVWWLVQVGCFTAAGYLLLRQALPTARWQLTACLALPAFYPVISTFWNGQLAAVLLLVACAGLYLYHHRRPFLAGGLFSLLFLKPQLAVGVALWLLLRRDWRASIGLGLGLLLQVTITAAALGPQVLADYAGNLRTYGALAQLYQFTPDHQHALPGIVTNLLGGDAARWSRILYLGIAGYSALLLFSIVRSSRRMEQDADDRWRLEQSAVVIAGLLMTPHLLTYDLSLLLIPIAGLWLRQMGTEHDSRARLGIALYLSATLAPLYILTRVSLVPFVLLWVLTCLYREQRRSASQPITSG